MSNFLRNKIEVNIFALHLYLYWRITDWSSNSGFALVVAYWSADYSVFLGWNRWDSRT